VRKERKEKKRRKKKVYLVGRLNERLMCEVIR
jgi:hypothetical protein